MDKIICGGFEWERNPAATDNRIDSGSLFLANAIAQDELSIDTLEADIWSLCRVPLDFEPADYDGLETADGKIFCCASGLPDLTTIPYGTPVEYYRNNALIARLYKSEISRVGLSTYRLSAVSAIGLLDKLPHSGGLYTGQTAGVVLADIIGGTFAYTVAPEVASIKVFGWLPMATRRDNLRQLLFAVGASVRKSADGAIKFVFLSASTPTEIDGEEIYTGGSVNYNTPATGVDVTEHGYYAFATDAVDTLFDNTDGTAADHQKVSFDGPHHDLTAAGITIHESGVNYAIVSGTGTLTGKAYTHLTKIVSRRIETTAAENIVTVENATLVSAVNSGTTADRVLSYYSGAKTVSADIVAGSVNPGDAVTLEDAFGDATDGIMQSMNITISNTLKANTTIITGYTPIYHGNDYNNRVLLTGEGTWTVPDGVTKAKVVLIGSGAGGTRGANGGAGGNTTLYFPGSGSKTAGPGSAGIGGVGGSAGLGGKILEVDITLTPGTQIAYQAHPGGTAGQEPGEAGTNGQDTVFGAYTSATGARVDTGYIDRMTGDILGAKGTDGVAGGNGGTGASGGGTGGNGGDVQSWKGGTGNEGQSGTLHDPDGSYSIGGGGGGGAVYGSDGANAPTPTGGAEGKANAGNGANAVPHPENGAVNYGTGGAGGNGGGGGGGAGQVSVSISGITSSFTWSASGGAAGIASVARNGSPGCAVIYF